MVLKYQRLTVTRRKAEQAWQQEWTTLECTVSLWMEWSWIVRMLVHLGIRILVDKSQLPMCFCLWFYIPDSFQASTEALTWAPSYHTNSCPAMRTAWILVLQSHSCRSHQRLAQNSHSGQIGTLAWENIMNVQTVALLKHPNCIALDHHG